MSVQSAGRTYDIFSKVSAAADISWDLVRLVGLVVLAILAMTAGLGAWYLFDIQSSQDNWTFAAWILGILTGLGVLITLASMSPNTGAWDEPAGFFVIHAIVGVLMYATVGVGLLFGGMTTTVGVNEFRYTSTGHLSYWGEHIPRHFVTAPPKSADASHEKDVFVDVEDTTINSRIPITTRTTFTLHLEVRPGPALEARIRALGRIRYVANESLNATFWVDNDAEYQRVWRAIVASGPEHVPVHAQYLASRPWLQNITVESVTRTISTPGAPN